MILIDMDHTLSAAHWRDHLIPYARETGDWPKYYADQEKDGPVAEMVELVRSLHRFGHITSILTTRPREYEQETARWLRTHGVPFARLLMRPTGDHRPSSVVKYEVAIDAYPVERIALVIDDRPEVLEPFQVAGVSTLLAMVPAR